MNFARFRRALAALAAALSAVPLAVALTAATPNAAAAQPVCGVELVLAMDVSRSVSTREYQLQISGLADAFRDDEVRASIRGMPGGAMVTVMIWGDHRQQRQTTPWTHLNGDPAVIDRFAQAIAETRRTFGFTLTGLGAAMRYAERLGQSNPRPCRRRVIDISGDGVWNDGPRPADVWRAMPRDLTVNGLVILGATPDPLPFYRNEVIGGPNAFVEAAEDFDDYARAIRRKLLRELAPALSMNVE